MNRDPRSQLIPLGELVAYQLGELPPEEERRIEEHVFECDACARELEWLTELGAGIVDLVRHGQVTTSITSALVDRALTGGLSLRSYRLAPGETVACTASPTDDFVVVRLALELRGDETVDIAVAGTDLSTGMTEERLVQDVAVDRHQSEVVLLYSGDAVRSLPRSRWTMQALAHSPAGERRLGPYVLDHTPWADLTLKR